MKLNTLKEQHQNKLTEMDQIIEKAEEKEADMDDDQMDRFNELKKEVEDLDEKIKTAEAMEARKKQKAKEEHQKKKDRKGAHEDPEAEAVRKFSFVKAIRAADPNGDPLDGVVKEMHEEAKREARESGVEIQGVGVPSFVLRGLDTEQRDLSVGTDSEGGHTVPEDMMGLIPILRSRMKVMQLGARSMNGLRGNIKIPRQNAAASAAWEGETDQTSLTSGTFDALTMEPHRLAATTRYSKQLIAQSSVDVENFVRDDLRVAIQLAVDLAGINGSGAGNEPEGILNNSGINVVSAGDPDGGAITRAKLVDLEKEIAVDDADVDDMAFLTTPGVRGFLKSTKVDAGSGLFIWGMDATTLLGYRAEVSTQVPNDLTKGEGASLHAVIFGNWTDMIIGNWAGIDLVVDPYTRARNSEVEVTINSWWDIVLRHAESFAAIKDADIS